MSDVPAAGGRIDVGEFESPVGRMTVEVTSVGVARVNWGPARRQAGRSAPPSLPDDSAPTAAVLDQLAEYFAGRRTAFDLPVDWSSTSGTAREVLQTLHGEVPYGTSVTYGELSALHGRGVPARAIGSIMATNPVPLIVPCHRVLAHDGLGGYSGGTGNGLEVKRWLLALEGVLPPTLTWPALG